MRFWNCPTHFLLIVLLTFSVGSVANAKVASGGQNLLALAYHADGVFNWLTCQGKSNCSTTGPPGYPLGVKSAPEYPQGFKPRTGNQTTRNNSKDKKLLEELREIEPGDWKKVYKDGFDGDSNRVSIHYFQSRLGKVFNVKVKPGWSN